MAAGYKEIKFEEAIEQQLLSKAGGYTKGDAAAFDRKIALFPDDVIAFIQATQDAAWKAIASYHGESARSAVLDDLAKALSSPAMGVLHVLRQGFSCFGKTLRIAHFAPANRMNTDTEKLYVANRLTVTRQVHFSEKDEKSLDLVIALNGIPVVTAELKNPLTHQNVHDAMRQYREDRDPREPLFRFKERALVHFAVDPDLAYMTTRLGGKSTHFLPFNRGDNGTAGNAPNPNGYRTAYLWEETWQRDSLLDILGRFAQLEKIEKDVLVRKGGKETVQKIRKENLIFPRYHQLDAVRRLVEAARAQGSGRNYLVQHSAGSGKSNTIAWLAHRLSTLHDVLDTKVFDSVIVITDRRVLDKQLQDTVYQFEHKGGVVKKIDEDSTQLAEALKDRTPIIITTLQKFPFVTEKIGTLPGQRYAVIVDEAHSSQSGEQAAELKGILNDAALRAKAKALAQEEEGSGDDNSDAEALLLMMLKRGRQPNISFFAFTATPKFKTLKIFDEPGPNGKAPFHLYTMRQAIEERFILDVLRNYTTYKAYYKLIETATEDPMVEKKEAAKALARFLRHHPHNLASKVEVMIEHFRAHTRHKIGGRAKAMLVTDSRLSAVRYKQAFDKYIAEKKYDDIKTLVAFSGTVDDPDFPGKNYSEEGMNQIRERELPEKFETEEYQVLIVAEKYQTGFDQPLLHTMYVDKRLDGVQAVQTLSRLNRTCAGKDDTFVLDFHNEREDIFRAFKPYYEATSIAEEIDPHKLYELKAKLDGAHVYFENQVKALCIAFFSGGEDAGAHAKLYKLLDPAVERFKALDETAQDDFRGWLQSFRNLYGFLSQVIPYQDSALERSHTYLRFLAAKLPPSPRGKPIELEDDVQLKFYRLQKIGEGQIPLGVGEASGLYGPSDVGTSRAKSEQVALSSLINQLNERFGTDFRPADQLFFDQVEADAAEREDIKQAARANTPNDFKLLFDKELEGLFVDRMEGNDEIFRRVMEDEQFRAMASAYLMTRIYDKAQTSDPQ